MHTYTYIVYIYIYIYYIFARRLFLPRGSSSRATAVDTPREGTTRVPKRAARVPKGGG